MGFFMNPEKAWHSFRRQISVADVTSFEVPVVMIHLAGFLVSKVPRTIQATEMSLCGEDRFFSNPFQLGTIW